MAKKGIFIISLDFELYWGEQDTKTLEACRKNLLQVRSVVPSLLKLFDEYGIHATWATVGFLFFETHDELIRGLPVKKPNYANIKLSPYNHIDNLGRNEEEDSLHYAPSLIKKIASFPHQEIGTHTFSHYYCLEKGQDVFTFKDDLEAAIKIAKKYNITIKSLVFPKNQVNSEYIPICKELGIMAYRGNPSFWIYGARKEENQSLLIRGLRLIDAYFNISGYNSYTTEEIERNFPYNIPASRFLRPYSHWLSGLERLRLRRILSELTYAAKEGLIYHLLWHPHHPHNFGVNLEKDMSFLKKILNHYAKLRERYGMESLNMGELSYRLIQKGKPYKEPNGK